MRPITLLSLGSTSFLLATAFRPLATALPPMPPQDGNTAIATTPHPEKVANGGDFWVTCPSWTLSTKSPRWLCGYCADGHGNFVSSVVDIGQCIQNQNDSLVSPGSGFEKDCHCFLQDMKYSDDDTTQYRHTLLTCSCTEAFTDLVYFDLGAIVSNEFGYLKCQDSLGWDQKECPMAEPNYSRPPK